MVYLVFACALCGSALVYLSHRNQCWLIHSLPSPARGLGWLLIVLSFIGWTLCFRLSTGIFAGLVTLMLTFGSFPYVSLLWRQKHARK